MCNLTCGRGKTWNVVCKHSQSAGTGNAGHRKMQLRKVELDLFGTKAAIISPLVAVIFFFLEYFPEKLPFHLENLERTHISSHDYVV